MFSMKFIFIIMYMAFFVRSEAQMRLNYDKLGIVLTPKKCQDTLLVVSENVDFQKVKIVLSDFKGQCSFEAYNNKNILVLTGFFANALDTLSKYEYHKILGRMEEKTFYRVVKINYLCPLPVGWWYFYDRNGKFIRAECFEYVNGW